MSLCGSETKAGILGSILPKQGTFLPFGFGMKNAQEVMHIMFLVFLEKVEDVELLIMVERTKEKLHHLQALHYNKIQERGCYNLLPTFGKRSGD